MSVCHHFLSFRQRHLLSRNKMITRGSTLAPKQLNFLTTNGARKQSVKVYIWVATQWFSQNTIHNGISTRARNYERKVSRNPKLWAGTILPKRHELPVPALQTRDIEIDPKAETYQEISVQGSQRGDSAIIWVNLTMPPRMTHTWNNSFARPIMGAFLRHGQVF
jgi:hypothetical protein